MPVPDPAPERRGPDGADVLLDVELVDGLLFLVLANAGDRPAHGVRVTFGAPLTGLGGERRIDRLSLFRLLEFLGPGRRIPVFLDRASLFFAREGTTAVDVAITWRTDDGRRAERRIRHDLAAYRDLPTLEVPDHARPPR